MNEAQNENSPIPPYPFKQAFEAESAIPPSSPPPLYGATPNYGPVPPMWGGPPQQSVLGKCVKFLLLTALGSALFIVIVFGFFVLLATMIGASAMNGTTSESIKVIETTLSGPAHTSKKIVILPIEGMITEEENGFVRNAIRTARLDPDVCAIVLRINSPGGTISGSDYYYHLLKELKSQRRIPIIVSMGPVAASGGYYISTVGDKIFAERSTTTPS